MLGGFIIFGVEDLKKEGKKPRIEGIEMSPNLSTDFGDRISYGKHSRESLE